MAANLTYQRLNPGVRPHEGSVRVCRFIVGRAAITDGDGIVMVGGADDIRLIVIIIIVVGNKCGAGHRFAS